MSLNWQKPRKPKKETRGKIVIHSDDGRMSDFTHWTKTIQRAVLNNNQFKAGKSAIFSPAVNSGYLAIEYGGISKGYEFPVMTEKEMLYIQGNGGEILSHGKHHNYLDYTPVTKDVEIGANEVFYSMRFFHFHEGKEGFIEEGNKKEYFNIVEVVKNEPQSDNKLIIDKQLTNNYTTNAKLHLSEIELQDMTRGNVTFLEQYGIECKNHVNAWYRSSDLSDTYLNSAFNSVIKTTGGIENPKDADLYALNRCSGVENTSDSYFIRQVDRAYELDGVAFIQGHGGTSKEALIRLDMIINYAYEKSVELVTHEDAIEHIKRKQGLLN